MDLEREDVLLGGTESDVLLGADMVEKMRAGRAGQGRPKGRPAGVALTGAVEGALPFAGRTGCFIVHATDGLL